MSEPSNHHRPPQWVERLLQRFGDPRTLEEVVGDLQELFPYWVEKAGPRAARRRYLWTVLRLLRPFARRRGSQVNLSSSIIPTVMLRNYFKVTLRLFAKNKVHLLINTLGLGIALACCMVAYLLFAYNMEFDRFHTPKKVARIFKIHTHSVSKSGEIMETIDAPLPLGPASSTEIAGIERYTRFARGSGFVTKERIGFREYLAFADSTFFEMFDFPLLAGDYKYFKDKSAIYLSEELAQKLLGTVEDPIGQMLTLSFQNEKEILVTVGGILDKIPENSTFVYNALLRFEHYLDIHDLAPDDWSDWRNPSTFLELAATESAPIVSDQLDRYLDIRNKVRQDMEVKDFQLEPFHAVFTGDEVNSGSVNIRNESAILVIFGSIAIMILLIACFNLTNTSIVMSTKRLKEIGIRKAVGAARRQIVGQFLSETLIIMAFSVIAGFIMAVLVIIPEFDAMFDFGYGFADLNGFNLFISLILILVAASLVAGVYPALFNSRLNPVNLVKGNLRIKGTNWMTRSLTAAQFALTVIFLIAGVLFFRNINFQENLWLGYEKDRLLLIDLPGESSFNILKNEINTYPKIVNVAGSYSHLNYTSWQSPVEIESQIFDIRIMGIGENYLKTVGLNVVQGSDLSASNGLEAENTVVVNKAFLERTALEDPFNQTFMLEGRRRRIVGIVENHWDNLQRSKEYEPFIFYRIKPEQYNCMVVNTEASDLTSTFHYLKKTWSKLFPNRPFDGRYQDEIVFGNSRTVNGNLGKMFLFLTILGTFLSIAGIFSLASLNINRKTKEIGIRKVLGATKGSIVALMNREFIIILLVAATIGSLGGFFLTDTLLSFLYKHHIPVGWLPVVLCAVFIFGMGYLTTSGSILRAAGANPIDALRNE